MWGTVDLCGGGEDLGGVRKQQVLDAPGCTGWQGILLFWFWGGSGVRPKAESVKNDVKIFMCGNVGGGCCGDSIFAITLAGRPFLDC